MTAPSLPVGTRLRPVPETGLRVAGRIPPAAFLRGWLLPVALVLCAVAPLPAAEPARQPNIIFIMADDLGYGDLGCYGQEQIQTPRLDALAKEGVRFTDFYAGATVCAPSRCVLMTGLHTGHCTIRGNGKLNLAPEEITVAEVLREAGYITAMFGKWGLGHEGSTGLPTRQGFDEFFGYLDQHHAHNYYPSFLIRNGKRVLLPNVVPQEGQYGQGVATEKQAYSHTAITAAAMDFLSREHDRPFFLYLPFTLPHANNEARAKGMEVPMKSDGTPDYGIYADKDWPEPQKGLAAMITLLDTTVGQVLDQLKDSGRANNTIVMFTSDNGPHGEGGNNPDFFNSNGPLRGIKRDLYEGGIRVPLIVRWPGHAPVGKVSTHAGYFTDVLATFAEIAGVKQPPATDGLSFLPAILGRDDEQKPHEALYWEFYERGSAQAVRMENWKGVVQPLGSDNVELYDLSTDIGETNNVAAMHPEVVAKVREAFRESHVPSPMWKPSGKPRAPR